MLLFLLPGIVGEAPPPAAGPVHRRRVLLVEDDRPSRLAMTTLLRARGFDVRAAATLAEGHQMLAWGPECVVLDLMLPDGNGAELLDHLRRHAPAVHVAVVTATGDPAMLDAVRRLAPELLLRKPIDIDALADFLDRC